MIHSLSGGVISENQIYAFVKTEIEGIPRWYLSPYLGVKAGDRVLVTCGGKQVEAVVVKAEKCTPQTAPCPINRITEIDGIL